MRDGRSDSPLAREAQCISMSEELKSRKKLSTTIKLKHHIVEVIVVGDGDESVIILAGEMVLEEGGTNGDFGKRRQFGEEG